MLTLEPHLKLPGKYGKYKWPTLMEAYKALVDPAGFTGAHDAMDDVTATHKVWLAIKREGIAPVDVNALGPKSPSALPKHTPIG